jgi:putative aminopeptidase FrvX
MGSPAEQRALQFAVEKFRSVGCQEAFLMPIAVAAQVNTSSGNAVGILKGKTDRIILIGGHIDSSGPDIPGANDDGSGAACVLELARVLSQRQNSSTIVFCCWGGEEEGLRGSEYFVNHFDRIDSVALMVQAYSKSIPITKGLRPRAGLPKRHTRNSIQISVTPD